GPVGTLPVCTTMLVRWFFATRRFRRLLGTATGGHVGTRTALTVRRAVIGPVRFGARGARIRRPFCWRALTVPGRLRAPTCVRFVALIRRILRSRGARTGFLPGFPGAAPGT